MLLDDLYNKAYSKLSGPQIGSIAPSIGAQQMSAPNPYLEQGKAQGLAINERNNQINAQNAQMAASEANANTVANNNFNMGMLKSLFGKDGMFNRNNSIQTTNFQFPRDLDKYSMDSPRPDPSNIRPIGQAPIPPARPPMTDVDIGSSFETPSRMSPFQGAPFMIDEMGRRIQPGMMPGSYTGAPLSSQSGNALVQNMAGIVKQAFPDNPTMQQVALTQAIHESGLMGRPSSLATKYNNYFGIKDSKSFPGTGGSVNLQTQEYIGGSPSTLEQGFSRNLTPEDSVNQYRNLMYGSSRYQNVVGSKTPQEAFEALQKGGYATDPRYARQLNNVYNRYVQPMF